SCARENLQRVEVPETDNSETPLIAEETSTYINVLLDDELTSLVEDQLASGVLRTKSEALNSVTAELGVESMERLFPFAGEYEPRTRREGLHRWYRVKLPEETPVTKAVKSFSAIQGIQHVEQPLPVKLQTNDPYWANNHWGLHNTSHEGIDVNCEPVWERFTSGDPSVVVAVLDGGIQLDHPDLAWNCLESGHYNYVQRNNEIVPHFHGTHVAGTIGAVSNNGVGVAGIAGGDYAKSKRGISLLSMQCFQEYGNYTKSGSFETAMKDAADKGAIISQNSWGYDVDSNQDGYIDSDEYADAKYLFENVKYYSIASAVDYFVKYAGCDNEGNQLPDSPMKGGLVVFAAGNDGIEYGAPGCLESVVAVGAITSSGSRASFSNYGDWVDICAPGTNIISTYPGSSYEYLQGTSMACPHVSGVAALIVSYFGGQGFTCEDLRKRLLEGGKEIAPSTGSKPIGPLVDAYGSFMSGEAAIPPKVEDFTLTPQGHNVKLNFDGNKAYGYLVLAAPARKTILNADLAQPSGKDLITGTIIVGDPEHYNDPQEYVLSGLTPDSDYYVAIAAFSYNRNFSDLSELKTVHTNVNQKPVIEAGQEGKFVFRNYQTVDIPFTISDPDGDPITVDFQTDGRASFTQDEEGLWHFKLACQMITGPASFKSSLVVTDEFGGKSSLSMPYNVLANVAPVLSKEFSGIILNKSGQSIEFDLDKYFSDEDGESLTYHYSGYDKAALDVELDGSKLTVRSKSNKLALSEIRVSAYDNLGAVARADIPCIIRPEGETVSLLEGQVVSDQLTIMTGTEPEKVKVRIVSVSGAVVYSTEGKYSAFDPLSIDISSLAPGIYTVIVTDASGKETKYTIVKR
ncbi:MAG: S8 family serine peptidase, partial [Bacteroidales bacterium]|nr:S8 family serine peptidase [Bacteroidales bacterium]